MDTSLERIREKIADLETKLVNLRIAEREIEALERPQARQVQKVKAAPEPEHESELEPKRQESVDHEPPAQQTIGATITDILSQHGTLSVKAIAEHVTAAGRDINNRSLSFTLQAMKKRGLVKSADGEWTLAKGRSRRARA